MTYSARYAAPHNALTGVQGSAGLDQAVFFAVIFGCTVKWPRDGVYRVQGNDEQRQALADWVHSKKPEGVSFGPEMPPSPGELVIQLQTERESPRRMWLHMNGPDVPRLIARAIDCGLSVCETESVGLFLITGPSQRQVKWVMYMQKATREQALQIMQATEEMLVAEDNGPPPITVALPDRETLSSVSRDEHGQIASVVQITRDVAPTAGEGTN